MKRILHIQFSMKSAGSAAWRLHEAFSELQEGKAFIPSNSNNANISNISIRNVLLGYYMGENRQDYLLPIVVFEGDNNFIAYVSAVKDEWIGD